MKSEPNSQSFVESFPTQVWGITRNYEDRDPAVPTENARVYFVIIEKEAVPDETVGTKEVPTENAAVRFSFRESAKVRVIEGPPPSEAAHAELWFGMESAGARVPGRHARQLLDVATYVVTVAGIVWGPAATLEMTDTTLPGWTFMLIVVLQLGGVGWFGRSLVRRKR